MKENKICQDLALGDYGDEAKDDIHLPELRIQGPEMAGQVPRLRYVELLG